MNEAAKFVMDKTTDPVISLYNRNTKITDYSDVELNILKKLKGSAVEAKKILGLLKEVGDVYRYIHKTINGPGESTAQNFRRFGLVPFEDIINDFIEEFKDELTNITSVESLELEQIYTTWDVVFHLILIMSEVTAFKQLKMI